MSSEEKVSFVSVRNVVFKEDTPRNCFAHCVSMRVPPKVPKS